MTLPVLDNGLQKIKRRDLPVLMECLSEEFFWSFLVLQMDSSRGMVLERLMQTSKDLLV